MNIMARLQLRTRGFASLYFLISLTLVSRPCARRLCCSGCCAVARRGCVCGRSHSRRCAPATQPPQIYFLDVNSCNANVELWLGLTPVHVRLRLPCHSA